MRPIIVLVALLVVLSGCNARPGQPTDTSEGATPASGSSPIIDPGNVTENTTAAPLNFEYVNEDYHGNAAIRFTMGAESEGTCDVVVGFDGEKKEDGILGLFLLMQGGQFFGGTTFDSGLPGFYHEGVRSSNSVYPVLKSVQQAGAYAMSAPWKLTAGQQMYVAGVNLKAYPQNDIVPKGGMLVRVECEPLTELEILAARNAVLTSSRQASQGTGAYAPTVLLGPAFSVMLNGRFSAEIPDATAEIVSGLLPKSDVYGSFQLTHPIGKQDWDMQTPTVFRHEGGPGKYQVDWTRIGKAGASLCPPNNCMWFDKNFLLMAGWTEVGDPDDLAALYAPAG